MNKKIVITMSSAIALILSGCVATSAPATPATPAAKQAKMIKNINNLPSWVLNPKVEGGIAAVGLAGYSKHGIEIMLPQAEMDARAKLAGQIQTIVSQVQKKAMRAVKVNDVDEFEKSFKSATKEVIKKMPLSGARRINMYQSNDGTLYVHTVIEKREVSKYIGDMKNTFKKELLKKQLSKQNIEDGMKVLDNMMNELNVEMK